MFQPVTLPVGLSCGAAETVTTGVWKGCNLIALGRKKVSGGCKQKNGGVTLPFDLK
jgi:hypothetical protein